VIAQVFAKNCLKRRTQKNERPVAEYFNFWILKYSVRNID